MLKGKDWKRRPGRPGRTGIFEFAKLRPMRAWKMLRCRDPCSVVRPHYMKGHKNKGVAKWGSHKCMRIKGNGRSEVSSKTGRNLRTLHPGRLCGMVLGRDKHI